LLCIFILLLCLIHPINAIGVFRNTTGTWYLDNNVDGLYTAGIDKEYQFGASGFTPVIGDWNGDGRDKIGVYKDGAWYLDYLGEGTWTTNTKAYGFGAAGYTPVIGDWNKDGKTKIGVYKDGAWYLDYLGEGTWTANTKAYGFGAAGYTPIIGDWNGDGRAKIGVYKDGAWYLDYLGEGTWTANTKSYGFGAPGYAPVIGNWNKDGKTKIGVYKDGAWYLDYLGEGTWTINTKSYSFGAAGFTPVIGDWNGDGRAKIGVYKDGAWYLDYLGEGTWTANTKSFQFGQSGDSPMVIQLLPFSVAPVAAFTSTVQSGTAPLTVIFTNKSTGTGPLTYAWDFDNDGTVDSTLSSPTHIYPEAGTYSVKLTATNGAGSDVELKTDYITVDPAPVAPVAEFTTYLQSGTAPLTVRFTDQSTGTAPLTYAWDFNNDGENESSLQNPLFKYDSVGTYTVTLTVINAVGNDLETKTDYITVTEGSPNPSHAGVALTFDDESVDQWFAIRDRLLNYNAHVTFYVSNFDSLNESQVNKLKILQEDGHEIAFHGLYHTSAQPYLDDNHSIDDYLNYEIIPGLELMKNQGFNPVDFSYPFGSENTTLTEVLQGYFLHIRGTAFSQDYLPLREVDLIYYQYGSHQPHIYGISIDDHSGGNSLDDIYDGILRAKEENKIVIFYSHTPVETDPQAYELSYDRLDKILKYISENDLKFYTISEIN